MIYGCQREVLYVAILMNPLDELHDPGIGLTDWDWVWVIRGVFFDMRVYGGSATAKRIV
jgi:hypothetical protein